MGCAQRPRKGWMGRQQRRKKGSRQYSVGTGQAAGRQTEEKKGGWEGGESPGRRPAAARRAPEARGWGPRSGLREGRGDTGGATRGLTMARRREVSDSRAGGAGQPPPPSRRSVSPGLAAGQLAPRPRLCPLARSLARWLGRPGRGAPPGRTETAACTAPPSPGPQPRRPLRRWPRLRSSSCPRPARPAPHPPRTAQLRTPRVSRVFSLCGISPAFRSGLCSGLPPRTKVVGRPEAFLFHL